MGCDGGTIPKRDELVKTKKKPEQKDKDAVRLYKWKYCALSQNLLKKPIVACELGRLYNKEEVIGKLLEKADEPIMEHVKSLKDIKELNLTNNPSYKDVTPNGDGYIDSLFSEYICPITSQEMNGRSRFSIIWSCGCVLSERALKEVKSATCNVCNKDFVKEDIIPLNPNDEEIIGLTLAMRDRRAKAKAMKKKKRTAEATCVPDGKEKKRQKVSNAVASSKPQTSRVNNEATGVLTSKDFQSMKTFSVADNPEKSEVFKSIFDTHKSAQGKVTSHWVTCNPQYF